MNSNLMHGAAAIVSGVLLVLYLPLLVKYLITIPREEWLRDQPTLVALGLSIESCGVVMISFYRTAQMYWSAGSELADLWTTVALALVSGGGVVLIRAATLKHGRWKWRLVIVLLAIWITAALLWPI
ncbi:MAG: hypothetical protein WA908_01425 [Pontixanthobacter sp.]